jgi:hypothetical protein
MLGKSIIQGYLQKISAAITTATTTTTTTTITSNKYYILSEKVHAHL